MEGSCPPPPRPPRIAAPAGRRALFRSAGAVVFGASLAAAVSLAVAADLPDRETSPSPLVPPSLFADPDPKRRREALGALRHDDSGRAFAERLLQDPDPSVRRAAVERFPLPDESAEQAPWFRRMLPLLNDPDPGVQRRAAQAMAKALDLDLSLLVLPADVSAPDPSADAAARATLDFLRREAQGWLDRASRP